MFFVFLTYSIFSFASQKYDYKNYWSENKIKTPNSEVVLYTKDSPLSYLKNIATVTVSVDSKDKLEDVVSIIKKSIGTKQWSEDKIDGLHFYETVDVQSGALFRLGINEKTKQFSLASVKIRYLMPSYLELHLIQVEKLSGVKSKTKSAFLYDLLFSKAYAGMDGTAMRASAQSLGQNILAPTADALNNNAQAIRSTGVDLRRTGEAVGGDIRRAGQDARAGLENAADTLGKDIRAAEKDATNTLKSTLSAENVIKLTAVVAFTSTLTSALTTFAINGTYTMFRAAYYQMMGQFPPEEQQIRVKRFEDSFATFKKLSPVMSQLNMKLDIFTAVLDSLSKEPTEVLLAKIDADIARAKKAATEAGSDCADCLEEKLVEIKSLEDMKAIVLEAGVDVAEKKGKICSRLDKIYGSYVETELNINMARKSIIQDTQVFIGAINDKAKVEKTMQEERMSSNACKTDGSESRLRSIKSKAEEEGCLMNPSSPKAICQEYQGLLDKTEACEVASSVKISDDLEASLTRSAGAFSKNLAYFSRELSQLDCSKYENGSCVKAGPYLEIKEKIRSKLSQVANECSGRSFATQFKSAKPAAKEALCSEVQKPKQNDSVIAGFFKKFLPAEEASKVGSCAQELVVTGGN
jgi:hypothetical protein